MAPFSVSRLRIRAAGKIRPIVLTVPGEATLNKMFSPSGARKNRTVARYAKTTVRKRRIPSGAEYNSGTSRNRNGVEATVEFIVFRNIVGFLVQIVPCAALCLIPFRGRLCGGTGRAWAMAFGIMAAGLVPFIALVVWPAPDSFASARTFWQNMVFLLTLAALFVLYVRVVDADTAHKTFVFVLVMCYGYLVTQTNSNINELLGITAPGDAKGFLYAPNKLPALVVSNLVLFVPMAALMRYTRSTFKAPITSRTWFLLATLPGVLVAAHLLGAWLPQLPDKMLYCLLSITLTAATLFAVWWVLRMARVVSDNARKQAQLEAALAQRRHEHIALEERLAQARDRVTELEREKEAMEARRSEERTSALEPLSNESAPTAEDEGQTSANSDAPVVLSTPNQAVSFRASDMTYAESLNRVRIVHLKTGESFQINMTLAQIAEALPPRQFLYCHRSVVVNLNCVKSVNSTELTLRDGTVLPMSRRRYQDFKAAAAEAGFAF